MSRRRRNVKNMFDEKVNTKNDDREIKKSKVWQGNTYTLADGGEEAARQYMNILSTYEELVCNVILNNDFIYCKDVVRRTAEVILAIYGLEELMHGKYSSYPDYVKEQLRYNDINSGNEPMDDAESEMWNSLVQRMDSKRAEIFKDASSDASSYIKERTK